MKEKIPPTGPHGNPPTQGKLAERLKDHLSLWNDVVLTATDTGATWRWMYSEKIDTWSYRAYLPGDRFFAALSLTDSGFEVSLNLKSEEWDSLYLGTPLMEAKIATLRAKADESGDDPAWIHLSITGRSDLPMIASLFAARARRIQPPKSSRRRR
ncbi:MAG TPA: DUF3788 family protein [Chroococcales cyanobacterium]|jgi:hypothetical protein